MKLHLGVIDISYENEGSEPVTTGDVATFLEDRYEVLQTFFNTYEQQICDLMADSAAGALENLLAGAPMMNDPFAESMSKVHDLFVSFLESQQMNGQAGVPTMRALMGISKRLKNKKGQPRPSFVDTGLYMASMRAWVSEIRNANS